MRVLVWNMNKRRSAWDYVRRNAANFDVAVLQEAHDPFSTLEDQWRSVIWKALLARAGLSARSLGIGGHRSAAEVGAVRPRSGLSLASGVGRLRCRRALGAGSKLVCE